MGTSALADKLFTSLANAGPWPIVVLVLGILALLLIFFAYVQRGRKSAILKIPFIASIDLKGQIEEVKDR